MAINKKNEFDPSLIELADFAKALSHPARLAILKELAMRKKCICGEIVEVLPLAQSTVSQHLKEMQQAGIITGTIDGKKSCYCIHPETFRLLRDHLISFMTAIEPEDKNLDCC